MGKNNNVIAVVDIGSTKVCAMIGRIYPEGRMKIEGEGSVSCRGFKKMMYADTEAITTSIKRALVIAQEKANIIVSSVYVNIRGIYLKYFQKRFDIDFEGKEKEISNDDIMRLIGKASKTKIFEDEKIVDAVPIKFYVDGDTETNEPEGMMAKSLSADINIIVGHAEIIGILCKCVQKLGLVMDGIIPESYPVAVSQLKSTEKIGKTLIIDMGGKITEFYLLEDGVVLYDNCIPGGGDNITSDIAKNLDISNADAETLKRDLSYAALEAFRQNRDCYITHVGTGDTEMVRASHIIGIIEMRATRILGKIKEILKSEEIKIGPDHKILIVGEGLRSMSGVEILTKNVFGVGSRRPDFFVETGYMPVYMVSYGIICYISDCIKYGRSYSLSTIKNSTNGLIGLGKENDKQKGFVNMLKEFFTLNE